MYTVIQISQLMSHLFSGETISMTMKWLKFSSMKSLAGQDLQSYLRTQAFLEAKVSYLLEPAKVDLEVAGS
jgi:hypothetical protein